MTIYKYLHYLQNIPSRDMINVRLERILKLWRSIGLYNYNGIVGFRKAKYSKNLI